MQSVDAERLVRRDVWMHYHQRGFLRFFLIAWGFYLLLFTCAGVLGFVLAIWPVPGGRPAVGWVMGSVATLLALPIPPFIYRVLHARVMVTEQEVLVQNVRRTIRVPLRDVSAFVKRTDAIYIPSRTRITFAGIALVVAGRSRPIRLRAFEKWPNAERLISATPGTTYFDETVSRLNDLLAELRAGSTARRDAVAPGANRI